MKKKYRILEIDPWLEPHADDIERRMVHYEWMKRKILTDGKSLADFASGHLFFGFHIGRGGWVYREWAPNAESVFLFGDFNGWKKYAHPMTRGENGVWEINVPGAIPHGSKVRICIRTWAEEIERIPAYSKRVVQNADNSFDGMIWCPNSDFEWQFDTVKNTEDALAPLLIYETHVGMSGEEARIASYNEFRENLLPRVKDMGYNAIQLMAIMEHPYYGSFGYQVSNFYAVSSRFGTPEELKELIEEAHGMGIRVFLDLVHSHAVRNEAEGLARFDGTAYQYFHEGDRGNHPQWDSKLFDYGKPEVLHFLLSNLKFWLDEYHFDGFRFDGITSMLYLDHGINRIFSGYGDYFTQNTDADAVAYLQLASELCKAVKPGCTLIAEDMSGMPGMCIPLKDGGIGFDYRLGMGVPDLWIRYLKEYRDEDWDIGRLWYELNQRRPEEKVVGYCESHDQALVGDKTIMFRLADQDMYWFMNKESQSLTIDRAMSLHKMIRLITCTCAGEAYLTFMGNEFGHPEWVDFPRDGNGNSYHHARRQWSLADNQLLRYHDLLNFDKAMLDLVKEHHILNSHGHLIMHHEERKLLAYEKNDVIFVFNFHPTNDAVVELPAIKEKTYEMILHTSWEQFGGYHDERENFLYQNDESWMVRVDRRSAIAIRVK